MNEEFNLSKKRFYEFGVCVYSEEDIKKIIKRIKEEVCESLFEKESKYILKIIDKLAGDKLIREDKLWRV